MSHHLPIWFALLNGFVNPGPIPDTSSSGLLKDVSILESTYKSLHPGLYRYNTTAQIDAAFKDLRRYFGQNRTLPEAYLAISELLSKIKCGHTYANFFNQPDEVAEQLFDTSNKVPFTFRWVRKKMVVTRDFSAEQAFPRGSEVVAIDGVPTHKILRTLIRLGRADGSNDSKRIADLEVTGGAKYESFDVFFPLCFPSASSSYTFSMKKPNSKEVVTVTAAKVLGSARRTEARGTNPASPVWTLTFPRPNTALLSMPTWAMYNSKWAWSEFLEQSFDQLAQKSIPNLVIDLRGNEGGDSVGDFILSRLVRERVDRKGFQQFTRYRTVPDELRPNISTWDKSFYDWGNAAKPDTNGFFLLKRAFDQSSSVVNPSRTPYLGKVFVLVGPENSSATFEFAYQVQRLKLGTLVGRPTGGSVRGINGGAFFFLTLPNSKIEVDVPLIAQFAPEKRPDRGVIPDIHVEPTTADIVSGLDVELAHVLNLISKSR